MDLNSDFSKRVVVHSQKLPWKSSPIPGVDRRMLDRLGDEVARATTIVRYAPESRFSPHVHTGGEEFLVLDGVFQDEHGDFPAGSYIRNPPESSHTPGSEQGCTIFVKLWQFDLADRTHVRVNTEDGSYREADAGSGVLQLPLFKDAREEVSMEKWTANTTVELNAPNGMEILVIAGGFEEGDDAFETHSWLRVPKGWSGKATTGSYGAHVWVKRGHLKDAPTAPS